MLITDTEPLKAVKVVETLPLTEKASPEFKPQKMASFFVPDFEHNEKIIPDRNSSTGAITDSHVNVKYNPKHIMKEYECSRRDFEQVMKFSFKEPSFNSRPSSGIPPNAVSITTTVP
jgi:hypothetical protein